MVKADELDELPELPECQQTWMDVKTIHSAKDDAGGQVGDDDEIGDGRQDNLKTNVYVSEEIEPETSETISDFVEKILESLIENIESCIEDVSLVIPKLFNPKPKIYKCGKCDKSFAQFESARKHKQKCQGVLRNSVICDTCKQSLSDKRSLSRHINTFHSNKPREMPVFKCEECDIIFCTNNKMKVHNANKHGMKDPTSEEDLIKCQFCDFTHLKMKFIKAHMTRVHSTKPKIKCTICDYECFSSSGMDKHLRQVHTVFTIAAEITEDADMGIDVNDLSLSGTYVVTSSNSLDDMVLNQSVSSEPYRGDITMDIIDYVTSDSVENSNVIAQLLNNSGEEVVISTVGDNIQETVIEFSDF